jgi:peptidyl-prolyl cis-trans isomerase B (cyclophilin B)
MNKICIALLIALAFSCEKNERTEITNENLKETLAKYGKDNPETQVLIETSFGNMRIRLYEETPLHRANFIKNIKEGVYEDALFYRVVYQFMIQAGIYPKELAYTVPAEFNTQYIHKKGALSMARGDENNPGLESSSTEFYIIHGSRYTDYQVAQDTEEFKLNLTPEQKNIYMTEGGYMSLDQQYTVFGEVVEGLDVIEKIASVKVHNVDKPLRKIELKISVVPENQR